MAGIIPPVFEKLKDWRVLGAFPYLRPPTKHRAK